MFSKMLIATDLSPASHAVVRCATGLASLGARECILLQCLNIRDATVPGVEPAKQILEQGLLEERTLLEQAGIRVETKVVPGFAQVEINRVAREHHCSVVVIGSHGHTLLDEMLLGGVATAVLHHAVTPVLVIRVQRGPDGVVHCTIGERKDFLRHVLFATDFSENAAHAFGYVEHLAGYGAGEITLLHVQDKDRISPHLMHRLEEFNQTDRAARRVGEVAVRGPRSPREDPLWQSRPGDTERAGGEESDAGGHGQSGTGLCGRVVLGQREPHGRAKGVVPRAPDPCTRTLHGMMMTWPVCVPGVARGDDAQPWRRAVSRNTRASLANQACSATSVGKPDTGVRRRW